MDYPRERPYEIGLTNDENHLTDDQMKALFCSFIETFRIGSDYIYREELSKNEKLVRVVVEHMSMFNTKLFEGVMSRPLHYLSTFRAAVNEPGRKERHIEIVSHSTVTPVRKLDASHINKISTIRGIVLSVSTVFSKAVAIYAFCKTCLNTKLVSEALPRKCESCSGADTFIASPEKSILQDIQYIKIQEMFEDLPVGEIARHLMICAADGLVDRVVPGAAVTVTGVYSAGTGKITVPFIRAIGISVNAEQIGIVPNIKVSRSIKKFASIPRSAIINSISPEVFGHKDVKLALACALFGGVQRKFEDGIRIRGDINVLLLGDPGIAKSQLLKFLSSASTRGVYTSGKGASAAGLTATVCKDKHGNFYLEGGALVLADGGLCCIDEFDKMQEKDRVAIHEAMEQQTISISKAGIVTSLNSRCAVVAAANPIFGRYDENRAPGENIDFGVTILSRFDLIFVIKDTMKTDKIIAKHVISRFISAGEEEGGDKSNTPSVILIEDLKEYAEHAKSINPVIDEEAAQRLQAFYIQTRKTARTSQEGKGTIPITVRQLEAIARISEALARMELESVVTPEHVEEAIRLFTASTMKAVSMGHYVEGMPRQEWIKEFTLVEVAIKNSLPIGISKPYRQLVKELCKNYSEGVVVRCLDSLIRKEKISVASGGKTVIRMP